MRDYVTLGEWFALALGSAEFQTLFGVAAPTCFAARVTGRVWPALVLTTALGWYVASSQLATCHVESGRGVLPAAAAMRGVLGAWLYVRCGFTPAAVLSAGYGLHLLWDVLR